jgi:glycosyl transferase-like sugar-binding protein
MRFLPNERLYSRTDECLEWLSRIPVARHDGPAGARERCHLYWQGGFSAKQAFAVKSFLATQDLERSELWLWLDGADGHAGHEENPFLRPLLPHIQVRRFDPEAEARGTPVEGRSELYDDMSSTRRSNLFRFVVLFKHGGIYADIDTMFLRDVHDLPSEADECCSRWSAHVEYANSAFLRLRQGSETARALLARSREIGSCRPRHLLRFDEGPGFDLLVLPCALFDPLWPHNDRKDRYRAAPFDRFEDFFRRFGWRFRRQAGIRSHRDFFPGAFAYHWHNFWDAPEQPDSYFGLFDREFDAILEDRLGVRPSGRG